MHATKALLEHRRYQLVLWRRDKDDDVVEAFLGPHSLTEIVGWRLSLVQVVVQRDRSGHPVGLANGKSSVFPSVRDTVSYTLATNPRELDLIARFVSDAGAYALVAKSVPTCHKDLQCATLAASSSFFATIPKAWATSIKLDAGNDVATTSIVGEERNIDDSAHESGALDTAGTFAAEKIEAGLVTSGPQESETTDFELVGTPGDVHEVSPSVASGRSTRDGSRPTQKEAPAKAEAPLEDTGRPPWNPSMPPDHSSANQVCPPDKETPTRVDSPVSSQVPPVPSTPPDQNGSCPREVQSRAGAPSTCKSVVPSSPDHPHRNGSRPTPKEAQAKAAPSTPSLGVRQTYASVASAPPYHPKRNENRPTYKEPTRKADSQDPGNRGGSEWGEATEANTQGLWSQVTSYFYGNRWSRLIETKAHEWNGTFQNYVVAVLLLHDCPKDIDQAMASVVSLFTKKKQPSLSHLIFAYNLYNRSGHLPPSKRSDFGKAVVCATSRFRPEESDPKDLNYRKELKPLDNSEYPKRVVHAFLRTLSDDEILRSCCRAQAASFELSVIWLWEKSDRLKDQERSLHYWRLEKSLVRAENMRAKLAQLCSILSHTQVLTWRLLIEEQLDVITAALEDYRSTRSGQPPSLLVAWLGFLFQEAMGERWLTQDAARILWFRSFSTEKKLFPFYSSESNRGKHLYWKGIIDRSSFERRGDFIGYLGALSPGSGVTETVSVRRMLEKQLQTDLALLDRNRSYSDLSDLLETDLLVALKSSDSIIDDLLKAVESLGPSLRSTHDAINLVARVFKVCSDAAYQDVVHRDRVCAAVIDSATSKLSSKEKLQDTFSYADRRDILPSKACEIVLTRLVGSAEAVEVISVTGLLRSLIMETNTSSALASLSLTRLKQMLQSECVSFYPALRLFLQQYQRDFPTEDVTNAIMRDIFTSAFDVTASENSLFGREAVCLAIKCFEAARSDDEQIRVRSAWMMKTFQGRCRDLKADDVTKRTLDWILTIAEDQETRECVESFLSCSWPHRGTLVSKIEEFEALANRIVHSSKLLSSDDLSIPLVARQHHVFVPATIMGYIRVGDDNDWKNLKESCHSKTLTDLRRESADLRDFLLGYQEVFIVAAHFLHEWSALFANTLAGDDMNELEPFKQSICGAAGGLRDLVELKKPVRNIKAALAVCAAQNIHVDKELSAIGTCQSIGLTEDAINNFRKVALLTVSAEPIIGFVAFCEQFSFAFVGSDSSFRGLKEIAESLEDENRESRDYLSYYPSLIHTFGDKVPSESSFPSFLTTITDLFRALAEIGRQSDAWTFVREMGWFGEKGLKRFYSQHDLVTNSLLGSSDSYEMSILDAVEPTVVVLSFLGGLVQQQCFQHFLTNLIENEETQRLVASGHWHDLATVQGNITQLRDWFTGGVDESTAVHRTLNCVLESGDFVVSCFDDAQLEMRFRLNGKPKTLADVELADFIRQATLVQREGERGREEVFNFLQQYQILSRSVGAAKRLHSVDFAADLSSFQATVGESQLPACRSYLRQLNAREVTCKQWLESLRMMYPFSLLFWTQELRAIYHELAKETFCADSMALKCSRLFSLYQEPPSSHRRIVEAVKQSIGLEGQNWFMVASDYVHRVGKTVKKSRSGRRGFQLTVHTVQHTGGGSDELMLGVLCSIYKTRLPFCFEILKCDSDCSRDVMELFLARVVQFPDCQFTILHAEALGSDALEKLVLFMSSWSASTRRLHLNCVQTGSASLHAPPSAAEKFWTAQQLDEELVHNMVTWRNLIGVDGGHIKNISIVSSPSSGAGKTRYIRETFNDLKKRGVLTSSLIVHERSSLRSLASDLRSKIEDYPTSEVALHVNVVCLSHDQQWLHAVNEFFFSFFVLGLLMPDNQTGTGLDVGHSKWSVFVEFPSTEDIGKWVSRNVPLLGHVASFIEPPRKQVIDEETRRVCLYLRAFRDGTINRKFESGTKRRQMFFLTDESGSMLGNKFQAAIDNAVRIFDSHVHVGDFFGSALFDHNVRYAMPVLPVATEAVRTQFRCQLDQLRRDMSGGGTSMYKALRGVLRSCASASSEGVDTWIICLTDGVSDNNSFFELVDDLQRTNRNLHVVVVGVGLEHGYEDRMVQLCNKFGKAEVTKGFYVGSEDSSEAMRRAFDFVASKIPVAQTFELDGNLDDDACNRLIESFLPSWVQKTDMLLRTFWVRFLYRRVRVFDLNESFNFNETHDALGSSLMTTMLDEVARFLTRNQSIEWMNNNHAQLIYDFTAQDAPEFRLLCTAPEKLDPALSARYQSLDLPGFRVPTLVDLKDRRTLDRYLSQAIGFPLNRDGRATCIDEAGFILTMDFAVKILCIHERVVSHIPCILEGETGVSKTALSKMYGILRNTALMASASARIQQSLQEIRDAVVASGYEVPDDVRPLDALRQVVRTSGESNLGKESAVAELLIKLLYEKDEEREEFFCPLEPMDGTRYRSTDYALELLSSYARGQLVKSFYEIKVDGSLTEADVRKSFEQVRGAARRLSKSGMTVVAFLDEVNTASILGLFKEILIDRSLMGEELERNIIVIAACNPARRRLRHRITREEDLGKEWATGHYQVYKLPGSMERMKWAYGSLTSEQEKDFIFRRLEALRGEDLSLSTRHWMTEAISAAHETIRGLAARHMQERSMDTGTQRDSLSNKEAETRAQSVVSLRDIQRVFRFFEFFANEFSVITGVRDDVSSEHQHDALLLALAMVYYFRLDGAGRSELESVIEQFSNGFIGVVRLAIDHACSNTMLPKGVAATEGLKENIFVTLACLFSGVPLLMVGPPGTSKTLSVNIVADNANGQDSPNKFYRGLPRVSMFHYQCSRLSTSMEIAQVFERASERQEKYSRSKHICVVFMDEAGLPEEGRESLKILHYLLEGHMSTTGAVSYVGISNHILDAAKSNRCTILLRQDPGDNEMLRIVDGVLLRGEENSDVPVEGVELAGRRYSRPDIARRLRDGYASLMKLKMGKVDPKTFFGLRDWVFLLKAMRRDAIVEQNRLLISLGQFVAAIERNFNGVPSGDFKKIVQCFVDELIGDLHADSMELVRVPVEVIREALLPRAYQSHTLRPRYKLIIDTTTDDSIMRLLQSLNFIEGDSHQHLKLSDMPEEGAIERLQLISKVKFAAARGGCVVLSQTESINESFYDLFNLHFRVVPGQNGVNLYTNIAVGGVSRRSLVSEQFECIMHVRESTLELMPAPFLNRFEKFRLDLGDIFAAAMKSSVVPSSLYKRSLAQVKTTFSTLLGRNKVAGRDANEAIMSIFVGLLPQGVLKQGEAKHSPLSSEQVLTFKDAVSCLVSQTSSIMLTDEEVADLIELTQGLLPIELKCAVENFTIETLDGDWDILISQNLQLLQREEVCRWNNTTVVFAIFVEIALTRNACSKLIHLLTPEDVFELKTEFPLDLIREYFRMDHFSINAHLKEAVSLGGNQSLMIIRTRTHQDVRRFGEVAGDESTNLGHGSLNLPDYVCVSHLMDLKSERRLREACSCWADDSIKHVFVLVVDMAAKNAAEALNFARTLVEPVVNSSPTKRCIVLLHYPESGRLADYPALFVGGWSHFFLDSVGTRGSSLGISDGIQNYCERGCDDLSIEIYVELQKLLPKLLVRLAAHDIVYEEQLGGRKDSLAGRQAFFSFVFEASVNGVKLKELLSRRFEDLWLGSAMRETIVKAASGVRHRSSNLGINATVKRVGIDAFESFLSLSLCDLNQWQNLSLLQSRRSDVLGLFELVMNSTLNFKFSSLLDMSGRKHRVLPYPTVVGNRSPAALFPFFLTLSLHIDRTVNRVIPAVLSKGSSNLRESISVNIAQTVVRRCHEYLESQMEDALSESDSAIASLIFKVLEFVRGDETQTDSLLERYVMQYMTCRIGCSSESFLVNWVLTKLDEAMITKDVVSAHCILRMHEHDLMKINSWVGIPALGSFLTSDRKGGFPGVNASLEAMSQCLEALEKSLGDRSMSPQEWSASFASFLGCAAVTNTFTKSQSVVAKMRALIFFQGIISASNDAAITNRALLALYDMDNGGLSDSLPALSLQTFWDLLGDGSHESNLRVAKISTLHTVFSPSWVKICDSYLVEDYRFLVTLISDGFFGEAGNLLASSLLTHAMSCFGSSSARQACQFLGFPLKPLTMTAQALGCVKKQRPLSTKCSTHWFPSWIRPVNATVSQKTKQEGTTFSDLFIDYGELVEYENELLAEAVFHTCLTQVVCLNYTSSSEGVFRRVVEIYDAVKSTDTQEYARVADLLAAGQDLDSVVGSLIGTAVLDASVLCLIGKIAEECCKLETPAALRGPYALECKQLLDVVMSSRQVLFQEFFANTVFRLRGGGTFAAFLNSPKVSSDFSWVHSWRAGSNESFDASNRALAEAERMFAEAREEEMTKGTDVRTCPECGNEFVVAALNCGSFVCGRDAHGQQQVQGHGCGASFKISAAGHYKTNQQRLNGLQATLNRCRLQAEQARNGAKQWEEANSLQPSLLLCLDLGQSASQCGLPVCQRRQMVSEESNRTSGMLRLIADIKGCSKELSLLPCLVEFYCWIHDTFSHAISREEAYHQTVADVVKVTGSKTSHQQNTAFPKLHESWNTIEEGWSGLMDAWDQKVPWNCAEIPVPFRDIGNASFSTLLSEGSDPLDEGNDYLYAVIHEIIRRYNDFVRRFEELEARESHANPIHPRFLAPGGSGNLVLGALKHLGDINLDVFVASAWDSESGQLDTTKFEALFHLNVATEHAGALQPIRDPLSLLRKRFIFKLASDGTDGESDRVTGVFVAQDGKHFSTRQDRELYSNLLNLLSELGLSSEERCANRLRLTLGDVFYNLSYQDLLDVLVGFRNILSCADKDGVPVYVCRTLGDLVVKILEMDSDDVSRNGAKAMSELGFPPDMRKAQIELLLSTQTNDIHDTISFFGDQVANGAFLFASLPFCVREPLRDESLVTNEITRIAQVEGIEECVEWIEEFVNHVLRFYEAQIVEAAHQSDSPKLRAFLRDQNFCDDESDPIFAVLPDSLTVRNYTSLRILLNRLKLKLMRQSSTGSGTELEVDVPTNGDQSWLWEQPEWLKIRLGSQNVASGPEDEFEDRKEDDCVESLEVAQEDGFELQTEGSSVTVEQVSLLMQRIHAGRIQRCVRHWIAVRGFRRNVAARKIWLFWKNYEPETEAEAVKENYFREEAAETIQNWWRFSKRKAMKAANFSILTDARIVLQPPTAMEGKQHPARTLTRTKGPPVPHSTPAATSESNLRQPVPRARRDHPEPRISDKTSTRMMEADQRRPLLSEVAYGSIDAEEAMRRWLSSNRLTETVTDQLVELGALDIEDVVELVQDDHDLLSNFLPLDVRKLERGVERVADNLSCATEEDQRRASSTKVVYGSVDAVMEMRSWLLSNRITETVVDQLVELGARDTEDVTEILQDFPELLSSFLPLDVLKLERAGQRIDDYESTRAERGAVYASVDGEEEMTRWLFSNRLSERVTNQLTELGARDIQDVMELAQDFPELLSGLLPLDMRKLQRTVRKQLTEQEEAK